MLRVIFQLVWQRVTLLSVVEYFIQLQLIEYLGKLGRLSLSATPLSLHLLANLELTLVEIILKLPS